MTAAETAIAAAKKHERRRDEPNWLDRLLDTLDLFLRWRLARRMRRLLKRHYHPGQFHVSHERAHWDGRPHVQVTLEGYLGTLLIYPADALVSMTRSTFRLLDANAYCPQCKEPQGDAEVFWWRWRMMRDLGTLMSSSSYHFTVAGRCPGRPSED